MSESKIHVLIVPSWFKIPERPIVGSFFDEQARMLKGRGHRVGVFYPLSLRFSSRWRSHDDDLSQPDDYVDRGIPIHHDFVRSIAPGRFRSLNDLHLCASAKRRFRSYVRSHGVPDLIHSHALFYGGIVGDELARAYDVPLVHTEHLTHLINRDESLDRYQSGHLNRVYSQAARVIVVGRQFKQELARRFRLDPQELEVIPNLVSEEFFASHSVRRRSDPFVFFTTSFLNPRKNHRLLFDAFKLVLERYPTARLRVGGYGPIERELAAYVQDEGLSDSVEFLGELSRERVVQEVADCHAFALASRYETFGVVLIESLAVGRPVVSTDSGGPRDIIDPSNGLLVTEHEPRPFAAAMVKMIDEYDRYDQPAISQGCRERFSESVIAERIEAAYDSALGRRRSAGA